MTLYRALVRVFSATAIALGVAMIAVTAAHGGRASVGYLLGVLFVALGVGRLYLQRRR